MHLMHLVPVPTTHDYLRRTSEHWLPFLDHISKRSKESVESLLDLIIKGEVQIVLVWDEQTSQAQALVGIHTCQRGDDIVGEIVWLTGRNMRSWLHLLPELETYVKHLGCVTIKPICRPGWSRLVRDKGYRVTHYIMEKSL
jgi:hypothetical protein